MGSGRQKKPRVYQNCFQEPLEEIKLLTICIGFHSNYKNRQGVLFLSLFSATWTLKGCTTVEHLKVGEELQFLSSHSVGEELQLHLTWI